MQLLLAAGIGAIVGLGLWLGYTALRGVRVLPKAHRLVPTEVPPERAVVWLTVSLIVGIVVGVATGWPVAGFLRYQGSSVDDFDGLDSNEWAFLIGGKILLGPNDLLDNDRNHATFVDNNPLYGDHRSRVFGSVFPD